MVFGYDGCNIDKYIHILYNNKYIMRYNIFDLFFYHIPLGLTIIGNIKFVWGGLAFPPHLRSGSHNSTPVEKNLFNNYNIIVNYIFSLIKTFYSFFLFATRDLGNFTMPNAVDRVNLQQTDSWNIKFLHN